MDVVEPGELNVGLVEPAAAVFGLHYKFGDVGLADKEEPDEEQSHADGKAAESCSAPGDGANQEMTGWLGADCV